MPGSRPRPMAEWDATTWSPPQLYQGWNGGREIEANLARARTLFRPRTAPRTGRDPPRPCLPRGGGLRDGISQRAHLVGGERPRDPHRQVAELDGPHAHAGQGREIEPQSGAHAAHLAIAALGD